MSNDNFKFKFGDRVTFFLRGKPPKNGRITFMFINGAMDPVYHVVDEYGEYSQHEETELEAVRNQVAAAA